MPATFPESYPIRSRDDVVRTRQAVREAAQRIGFGLVDQTKLVTAASELARNAMEYGGGGTMLMEILSEADRAGLRLIFEDHGPGIPDVELALRDGYTTGGGLGLGLGGARRLVNEFEIQSAPDGGTRVSVTRWRR